MEIILIKDIERLGQYGDIKTVKDGYARNFLIPQGLAVSATKENKEKAEAEKAKYLKEREIKVKEFEDKKKELEKLSLEISVKVGVDNKMFGSVTGKDVADEIYQKSKKEIDKKDIEVEPIHEIGDYKVFVKLGEGIRANIKLKIVGEKQSATAKKTKKN